MHREIEGVEDRPCGEGGKHGGEEGVGEDYGGF